MIECETKKLLDEWRELKFTRSLSPSFLSLSSIEANRKKGEKKKHKFYMSNSDNSHSSAVSEIEDQKKKIIAKYQKRNMRANAIVGQGESEHLDLIRQAKKNVWKDLKQ